MLATRRLRVKPDMWHTAHRCTFSKLSQIPLYCDLSHPTLNEKGRYQQVLMPVDTAFTFAHDRLRMPPGRAFFS